jgi:Predicted signal-transduction protein containing cAMP-binding and CBS domains
MRIVRRVAHPATSTTARELMGKSTVSADPRQSLVDAAALMRTHRTSVLAVLDGQAIVGVITERDFMRAIADGRDPASTHVSEYMTHDPKTIEAGKRAAEAAAIMVKHHVRHIPVTEEGRVIGFLSARDLLALTPWPLNLPIGESW